MTKQHYRVQLLPDGEYPHAGDYCRTADGKHWLVVKLFKQDRKYYTVLRLIAEEVASTFYPIRDVGGKWRRRSQYNYYRKDSNVSS